MGTINESETAPSGKRVLTVEDDPDVAESFRLLLEIIGSEVCIAADGPGALDLARRFRPDVVFVDLDLPGMDGYEVAARLRKEYGGRLRLYALTGFSQEAVRGRALDAGFDQHLVKPLGVEQLKALLDLPS